MIVINAKINGRWGREVRYPWPEIYTGQTLVVVVHVARNGYEIQVLCDRNSLRFGKSWVEKIQQWGAVIVH